MHTPYIGRYVNVSPLHRAAFVHLLLYSIHSTWHHDCLPLQVFAVLLLVIAGLWCRVHHWGIIELSSTEEWDLLKTNAYVCTYLHMWLG